MPLNITPKHPDSQPHSGKVNTPAQTLALLATAGAGFVPLAYRAKRSYNQGWQHAPMALDAALAHLDGGGNVGVLGGHNGVYIADFDRDLPDALGHRPELADPTNLHFWRDNAPDRGKFVFRCVDALPNVLHPQIEIKALGTQAVVTGVHDSGAIIRSAGGNIPTLTYDQVADLVAHRTGAPMAAAARLDAGPPDAAAVARSVDLVTQVTAMAGVALAWKPPAPDGTAIAIMHRCPFNPPDDPHGDDDAAAIIIGSDGRIGATCHHGRCQERIAAHEGGGWALLKDLAGYVAPARPEVDPGIAAALVDIIRRIAPDDLPIAQSPARWRNASAAALAIVKIAQTTGRFTGLSLGVRRVAEQAGLSRGTAAAAVKSLAGWFLVADGDGADPTVARRYSIARSLLGTAEDACFKFGHVVAEGGIDTHVSKFETSMLRPDYMGTDAFLARQLPMKESELKAKIADREAEIAHIRAVRAALEAEGGANLPNIPPAVQRRRYIRRLGATVASPGPAVLVLMDLLAADGAMTRSALAEAAHVSRTTLWRTLKAGVAAGVLRSDGGRVALVDGWEAHIAAETPKMPTAGVALQRQIDNMGARIAYLEFKLRSAANEAEKAKLKAAINRVAAKRQKLMARQAGRDVGVIVAGARLTNARYDGDTLQMVDQGITARKPRQTMTADQYRAMQLAMGMEADAAATWARMHSVRSAERGHGWFAAMTAADVMMDFAHFAATGYGVAA